MKDEIKSTEINVNKENIIPIADVKQESQCVLTLELYKDNVAFDITGQTVKLGAKTADGNVQLQESGFTINKNILTVDLKSSINSVVGLLEIDLTFTDSTGIMTTSSFYLNVIKKTLGKDNIIASNQLEAVKVLIEDLKTKGNNTIADIKKDYDSLKKVIIDNNVAANLQEQINVNKNRIEQLEDLTPVWQEHEGTGNITVNDSFDGVAKDLVVKGRTLRNLLNNKNIEFDSVNNRLAIRNSENKSLFANKTYTLFNLSNKTIRYTIDRISNNSYIRGVDVSANTISVVSLNEDEYISIIFGAAKDGWENSEDSKNHLKQSCVILEGSYNCNPFNSHFDSITSSGEQEDNKIKLKSVGKNLFNSTFEIGGITGNTGLNYDSSTHCRSGFIKVPKNSDITVSGLLINESMIFLYDSNKNYIRYLNKGDVSTYTISTDNVSYVRLRSRNLDNINNSLIMIEEGSVATNHEQYSSKLIEIPLPFEGGLKSLPNGISDEIYDNGKLIQKIEKRAYKHGGELLPNVITDKKNTIIELSKYKTYDINPFFLRTFNQTTHLYQENNVCGEISFEIAKDRNAIINGNIESISKLSEISDSHENFINKQKDKNQLITTDISDIKTTIEELTESDAIQNRKIFYVDETYIYIDKYSGSITSVGEKKDYTIALKKALENSRHGSKIILPNNIEIVLSDTIVIDKGVVIDFNNCLITCNKEGGMLFDLRFTGENNPRISLLNYVFVEQLKIPDKYIAINGSINTLLQGDFFLTKATHSQIHNYKGYGTKIIGEMRYYTSPRAVYMSSSSSDVHSFDIYVDVDITGQKGGVGIEVEGGTLDINGVIENCEQGGFYFNGIHNLNACKLQIHCEKNSNYDVKLGKDVVSSTVGSGQLTILNSCMIPSTAVQVSPILIGSNINLSIINSQGCFVKNISGTVTDCSVNVIGKGTYTEIDKTKNRSANIISYGTSKFNEIVISDVTIKDNLVQSVTDVLRFGVKGGMFQCKNDGGILPESPTTATVGGRWNSFKSVYAKELILFDTTGKPWKGTVNTSGTLSFVSAE